MDVESLAKELILKNMTPEQQMAVLDSVRESVAQAKEVQKRKIGENVDLVVQALKKIESDITTRFESVGNSIEKRVLSIKDGRDGSNGKDGRDGKDGKSGKDGLKGDRGLDGQAGRDGVDGVDGVSVVNANIDFDGSLVISLSDGREINVGEVVSADVAEKIKVISTMSTNAAIAVKEEGTTLTSGVKSLNFVGTGITATTSGDDVTVTVASGSGTVTSVAATVPAFLSVTGSPITTSGTLAIGLSGTALPVVNGGTGVTTSTGTGNAVLSISPTLTTPALGTPSALVGTNITGTATNFTASNVTTNANLTGDVTSVGNASTLATVNTNVGSFTNASLTVNGKGLVTAVSSGTAPVTSVTGTSPVASSGGATPAISLEANYGDTQNPYASKTAKFVLAAPNASAGVPTFRAIVASDIPTLNQNTTGSAATLTTARAIYGNNFDGSAALTQIIASTYGGTGNGFTKFTGATTAERTYTLPDANSTIVVQGGALGTPSGGTLTNCTFPTLNQNTTGSAASLSATLVATSGGTGQSSYAIGDLLYASTTTALSKLADVATGNALISGGVGVAPSWGKIGLTTHISGTLAQANGGTGVTNIPAFSATPSTTQTVTTATYTKVNLGTENFDTNSNFASSRFTPTIAGYYQLNASVYLAVTGGTPYYIWSIIYKNGVAAIYGNLNVPVTTVDGIGISCGLLYMNGSTDYVESYVYATSSAGTINVSGAGTYTVFSGVLVRGA
jgi:hypothetical protein